MVLLAALAAFAADPRADAVGRYDAARAQAEAVAILGDYVRADTRNPGGRERDGIAVITDVLDGEGIGWEIREFAPGRPNLVARLPSAGRAPPVCLLHHVDVVDAEAIRWSNALGPFAGEIAPGPDGAPALWGRGALDMKSTGVAHLLAFVWLHRLRVPLDRDVVLLVTGDEEVHNAGIAAVMRRWDDLGCSHVIGEGGIGIRGALFDDQVVYPITVAEKGALWVQVTATGAPGHGSVPDADSAPWRLVRALRRLEDAEPRPRVHPAVRALLAAVGRDQGGLARLVMTNRALSRALVVPRLRANPGTAGVVGDTINVTGFGGLMQPNVVPSEVFAVLDCRILPGTTADEMLARLAAIIDDPAVRLDVITRSEAPVSPWEGDPVFDALARAMIDGRPHVVAGPMVSVASSDSVAVREAGVIAYGIGPFELDEALVRTMHGDDERIPLDELGAGVRRMFLAVLDVAAAPEADPAR